MAEHIWTVFCDKAIVDQISGNVSLIEVIESVAITPESVVLDGTAQHPSIGGVRKTVLISLWTRSNPDVPEKVPGRWSIRVPGGKRLEVTSGDIDLTNSMRVRTMTHVEGLPFAGPGRYIWVLDVEKETTSGRKRWVNVAKVPFELVIQEKSKVVSDGTPALAGASKKTQKKKRKKGR